MPKEGMAGGVKGFRVSFSFSRSPSAWPSPSQVSMESVPGLSLTLSRNVYQTQAPPGRASTSRLTLIHLNGPKPW